MTCQSRDELNRKARERMAARRQTPEYQEWLLQSRELRRSLKEKYRRQAGAQPRDVYRAAAVARRELAEQRRALRDAISSLHDAHVQRFRKLVYQRVRDRRRYLRDPQAWNARTAKLKRDLADSYVRELLRAIGIANDEITPEMIEMQREATLFRRLAREIRKAIANHNEENHEAITEHA